LVHGGDEQKALKRHATFGISDSQGRRQQETASPAFPFLFPIPASLAPKMLFFLPKKIKLKK
jgi:hypothetical protein